jgi:hypothetical protein
LKGDAPEPLGLSFETLLRERRTKHVAQQSLTPDDIERAGLRRSVKREAVE